FELIIFVEPACDFRKILAREWLSTGDDQHSEVRTQCFADSHDVVRRHLQLLSRLVIEFIGEEAMDAAHVADGSDQNIEQDRRKWAPSRHPGVAFENLFVVEIHIAVDRKYSKDAFVPLRLCGFEL